MHDTNNIKKRVNSLRKIMKLKNIEAFLLEHEDERLLENTPKNFERLSWISGFSGSAGYLVVSLKNLYLFVDGRYTLQAKKQTKDLKVKVYNVAEFDFLKFLNFFKNKLNNIALDPKTISVSKYEKYKVVCKKNNINIINLKTNIVDLIWSRNTKTQKTENIFLLSDKKTGLNYKNKIKLVLKFLDKQKANAIFIQNSESIAWLLNIRGKDLEYTPVVFSFSLITKNKIYIFLENKNIPINIKNSYDAKIVFFDIKDIPHILNKIKSKKHLALLDPISTSQNYYNLLLKNYKKVSFVNDPILEFRSVKNTTEIYNFNKAHLQDGIALCKFLFWVKNKKERDITELDLVQKIEFFRKQCSDYICKSFPTIAGASSNGAIIHYIPNEFTNKKIKKNDIILLDSGGQYQSGTTDVTRTIAIGKPTSEQIKNYTLVLKGHINLSMAVFPEGISGNYLDAIARSFLWQDGKDFAHGTGHGVGFCLNVHEGPFSISSRSNIPLKNGMVFSNEPGYYKEGSYGIRIENLVTTKKISLNKKNHLKVNTLTLAPYETKLIENNMLNNSEKMWLNKYNKDLFDKVSPYLVEKERNWLYNICK
tara:strand:+ start:723 stop:2498 length:1776 start_codon:yes stop_codon:yes gene_type:complete